jgi:hypothetical protein
MKLEIFGQIFEKYSNIEFYENRFSESWVVPWERTDRHDDAKSRFSQYCERHQKLDIRRYPSTDVYNV